MILVAVVDDRMGLCFHGRRQSQDKRLREKILTLFAGKTLWMNGYSAKQFAKDAGADAICVAEDFLTQGRAKFALWRTSPQRLRRSGWSKCICSIGTEPIQATFSSTCP